MLFNNTHPLFVLLLYQHLLPRLFEMAHCDIKDLLNSTFIYNLLSCPFSHGIPSVLPFRQYYEMLYNTADELLNLVVDQGVRYTELEYINALSLLHRSQTGVGDLSTQNTRLQRLKEIICEQAAIKQATKDKKITTV